MFLCFLNSNTVNVNSYSIEWDSNFVSTTFDAYLLKNNRTCKLSGLLSLTNLVAWQLNLIGTFPIECRPYQRQIVRSACEYMSPNWNNPGNIGGQTGALLSIIGNELYISCTKSSITIYIDVIWFSQS